MTNTKGFTLTEVLLAATIVGVIGVALAALTTAAVRESGLGRTRGVMRNQVSLALRQLRQDTHNAVSIEINSTGTGVTLGLGTQWGPSTNTIKQVTYQYNNSSHIINRTVTRSDNSTSTDVWVRNVKAINASNVPSTSTIADFQSPRFELIYDAGDDSCTSNTCINSLLRVQFALYVEGEPPVTDVVEETFALPQGFSTRPVL